MYLYFQVSKVGTQLNRVSTVKQGESKNILCYPQKYDWRTSVLPKNRLTTSQLKHTQIALISGKSLNKIGIKHCVNFKAILSLKAEFKADLKNTN